MHVKTIAAIRDQEIDKLLQRNTLGPVHVNCLKYNLEPVTRAVFLTNNPRKTCQPTTCA